MNSNNTEEKIISTHSEQQWRRREIELSEWVQRHKQKRRSKQTACLGNIEIDIEMLSTLTLLKRKNIETEFSCAGVSVLDEPEDHSLYGYLTLLSSSETEEFVKIAIQYMRHRLLVTYEPSRNRYDLSSFYIGHNRSFCLLLENSARLLYGTKRR